MSKGLFDRVMILAAAVLILGTPGWARKYQFAANPSVPAASGNVDTHKDKNGNIQVHLSVSNLARPSELTPPATDYVVWFQPRGSEPQNEGQLTVSGRLKGDFKASAQTGSFDVFITAESDGRSKSPSGQEVLRTTVQQ